MKLTSIIQPEEFIALQNDAELVLIDASAGSKTRYDERHLHGAIFADVNADLANIGDFAMGGRHPLPEVKSFASLLGEWGVSPKSHVVVYDDKNASNAAARLWWMLRSVGHERIQVLNGGFEAAVQAGFPVDAEPVVPAVKAVYPVQDWKLPLSSIEEVEKVAKSDEYIVIDVRDATRYAGLTEPIDLIAGHIPGAINIPFTENMDGNGFFLPPELLKNKYAKALADVQSEHVIVHCGSGITACHTLLAMDYAGLEIPKLYVGSWSEWSRRDKEMILAG